MQSFPFLWFGWHVTICWLFLGLWILHFNVFHSWVSRVLTKLVSKFPCWPKPLLIFRIIRLFNVCRYADFAVDLILISMMIFRLSNSMCYMTLGFLMNCLFVFSVLACFSNLFNSLQIFIIFNVKHLSNYYVGNY